MRYLFQGMMTLFCISMLHCVKSGSVSSGICTRHGLQGNGQISTQERMIPDGISAVDSATGIQLHITIDSNSSPKLKIQAESNIFDRIYNEMNGNTLRFYAKDICITKPIDVFLTLPNLTRLSTSSGSSAEVKGNSSLQQVSASSGSFIKVNGSTQLTSATASSGSDIQVSLIQTTSLQVEATSGSHMNLQGNATSVVVTASSGAHIKLLGTAQTLHATASSGSEIDGKNFRTLEGEISTSSGSEVDFCSSSSLQIHESSGGEAKNHCQ